MIRVALVLGTSTGGIGRHVRSLASGLVRRGHEVTVYGPAATQEQFAFTATGAAFEPVDIPVGMDLVRIGRATLALRSGLRDAEPPDVVHAHGMRAGMVAGLARRSATPLVVTWHNIVLAGGMRGRLLTGMERAVARAADITLCASQDMVGRLLRLGARDVRLAPVAAPSRAPRRNRAAVRHELGAVDGQPFVLSVGRLHPQKDFGMLVDAAARWRDLRPPPLVAIAGAGPQEAALRARVAATGADIRMLGQRDDVADLLAACDLAVVTSRWEARQLFAQEALTAGRPLVATSVGGLPDLVGDAAVLVPAGDLDAFDAAVRGLLADDARRADYAARATARAATWPSTEDTVAQVAAVYAELAERR